MGMRAIACALGMLLAGVATTAPPARAEEAPARSHGESLFARYCAGCHALDAHGVAATRANASAPDLSHLARRSDEPLALEPLVAFVTSPRRPGTQRICGERVFARLPTSRFREHAERWIVRAALDYVANGHAE